MPSAKNVTIRSRAGTPDHSFPTRAHPRTQAADRRACGGPVTPSSEFEPRASRPAREIVVVHLDLLRVISQPPERATSQFFFWRTRLYLLKRVEVSVGDASYL